MTAPTYAQNKIHQLAYQKKNRAKFSVARMVSYYKNKNIFYRETYAFGKIHLSFFL